MLFRSSKGDSKKSENAGGGAPPVAGSGGAAAASTENPPSAKGGDATVAKSNGEVKSSSAIKSADAQLLAKAKDPDRPNTKSDADKKGNGISSAKPDVNVESKAAGKSEGKTAPKAEAKKGLAKSVDRDEKRAQAALEGEYFVVPLGAYLNQANVKTLQAKVTVAGFKSYSEPQKTEKGEQIRVRAGPFATREEAERARDQLRANGLTVGPVTKQ